MESTIQRLQGFALLAVTLVAPFGASASFAPSLPSEWAKESVKGTVFQLVPNPGGRVPLKDAAGKYVVTVTGGKAVPDPTLGASVVFGDGSGNGIWVRDNGDESIFQGGVTLEAWLQLDEPMPREPKSGAKLGMKAGSFLWSITPEGKLNNTWLVLPTEPVATDNWRQYNYHPVGDTLMNGEMELPVGRWTHLVVTYDEKTHTFRSWIDGGLDRDRQFAREGPQPLGYQRGSAFVFLQGMRNCRVGGIRLRSGAHDPAPAPPMALFVNQLPWEGKTLVTLDRISDGLPFPLEAVVLVQSASGAARTVSRTRIAAGPTAHIEIPMSGVGWRGSMSTLIVKVFAGNRQVFTDSRSVVQSKPAGPIAIRPDKALSIGGRAVFPRLIYHVFPEDLPAVAAMGFNVFMGRDYKFRFMAPFGSADEDIADRRDSLDKGMQSGLFMALTANFVNGNPRLIEILKGHPGLLTWYAFDEPWGRLDRLRESYNTTKLVDAEHPVVIVQNNASRFRETAEGCDILGCDSYPIPNVSLRAVADATRAAVKAVYGRKPVWTVLPAYSWGGDNKLPSLEELRCMVYLAVCEGANGLGIYAWDDRPKKKDGYYMRNHPETIEVVTAVMGEVKSLETILVAPNLPGAAGFSPRNSSLHASIKQVGAKRYLFLANDSRQEEAGTLVLRDVGSATARPILEGGFSQKLEFKDGKVAVRLPCYCAAVFELVAVRPDERVRPGAQGAVS